MKILRTFMFSLVAWTVAACAATAVAQSTEIAALELSTGARIAWIPERTAGALAIRRYQNMEIRELLKPFAEMALAEAGGEIREFQFRFHIGSKPYVVRGTNTGSEITAYLFGDADYDFDHWAWLPSLLSGDFHVVAQEQADRMSDIHQRHFEAFFGPDVMLEDMQISVEEMGVARRGRIVIFGVMRWKPPRTHLHSVIICRCL